MVSSLAIAQQVYYLVQAQLAVSASAIVTTDEMLKAACHTHSIPCKGRDEFVTDYLSTYRNRGGVDSRERLW